VSIRGCMRMYESLVASRRLHLSVGGSSKTWFSLGLSGKL